MTFQKRQKEMKRQEKQRMKAERRAERKLAKNAEGQTENAGGEVSSSLENPVGDSVEVEQEQ